MPPILQADRLHHRYGDAVALDDVSLAVEEGELFGLLGPNGAGKTTLLSLVAGLLEPTAGQVSVLGKPLRRRDLDARRAIGLVPQELAVYDELTAAENLRFFGELYGCRGPDLAKRVDQLLAAVGLEDRAGRRVDTFSGGMKRRLNLAVALVHRPRLLLLDEPTVGVNPQSRNRIFEEVRRLNAEGLTVVYTSHYMEEVQALCRRVGIIDHGRLVACAPLTELLLRVRGVIRLRAEPMSEALRSRLRSLPGTTFTEQGEGRIEVGCDDVKATLARLVAALNETGAELHGLETEEPNLERVFFELTRKALRD